MKTSSNKLGKAVATAMAVAMVGGTIALAPASAQAKSGTYTAEQARQCAGTAAFSAASVISLDDPVKSTTVPYTSDAGYACQRAGYYTFTASEDGLYEVNTQIYRSDLFMETGEAALASKIPFNYVWNSAKTKVTGKITYSKAGEGLAARGTEFLLSAGETYTLCGGMVSDTRCSYLLWVEKIKHSQNITYTGKDSVSFYAKKLEKKATSFKFKPSVDNSYWSSAEAGTLTAKATKTNAIKCLSYKNGKVIVKKGTKRGVYTMKIKATAAATPIYYEKTSKVFTITVYVW